MSYIELSNYGGSPFEKLMGHVPNVLNQWGKLEEAFFQSNTFTPAFLEQVRRTLAFKNLCQYCMLKAGPPDDNPDSVRLAIALKFANKFAIDHTSILKEEIKEMGEHFSNDELVELIAFCSFISASQKFGSCLGLQSSDKYHGK
jgi:alkylhydroperoxidase family enzyme